MSSPAFSLWVMSMAIINIIIVMIVNQLGNAIKHEIQNVMISMVIVIIVSLLGNARLNIVRLDPLAQPLHRAVAVERIWSQSPEDNEDGDDLQVMKILTVMMMKTWSVMTKWSLYDCGMGLGQGLYNESVHNGARLIYALASTQSTCTHTLSTWYRRYFYSMNCAGRNQVFIFVPRLCIIHTKSKSNKMD